MLSPRPSGSSAADCHRSLGLHIFRKAQRFPQGSAVQVGQAIFTQALDVEADGITDFCFHLGDGRAGRQASAYE
jgi:hypothetical protein